MRVSPMKGSSSAVSNLKESAKKPAPAQDSGVSSSQVKTAAEFLGESKQLLLAGNHDETFRYLQEATEKIKTLQELNLFSEIWGKLPAETKRKNALRSTTVAFGGNATFKLLADTVTANLLGSDIVATCYEIPFDQWAQELLKPDSHIYQFAPSFFVFYLSSMGLTRGGVQSFDDAELLSLMRNVFGVFSKRLKGTQVIWVLPEPLEEELYVASDAYKRRINFVSGIMKAYQNEFIFVDPAWLISILGASNWYASRFWYTSKMPCHPNAFLAFGKHLGIIVSRCIVNPIKAIVCDLDNLLWGGIVGEDGVQGINLDANTTGGPFLRLQNYLKSLKNQGMILAIASKNNEAEVRAVFEQRPEMILKWEAFAAHRINWKPKSDNIRDLARELNLRTENFCFLDDSPYERALVRSQLPEIQTPEIPVNAEEVIPFFLKNYTFCIPKSTEEDKGRTELYHQERQRSELRKTFDSIEDYLKTLQMEVTMIKVGNDNLERVAQLVNKTNQFNLTSRRYSAEAIRQFNRDNEDYLFCARLQDKFGDSGIIGVFFAFPEDNGAAYRIDTWLLSCRAMGRNVEHAMFHHFLSWSAKRKVKKILGEYVGTEKNSVVSTLFSSLGFSTRSGAQNQAAYEFDCAQLSKWPDVSYFQIKAAS